MQWMISHQQARRNLSPGELIFANSMVAEEIAEENKKKQIEGNRIGGKGGYKSEVSVQMDGNLNQDPKSHTSPTHTREQVAKLSGVGTGTVARYEYKITSRRLIREVIVAYGRTILFLKSLFYLEYKIICL